LVPKNKDGQPLKSRVEALVLPAIPVDERGAEVRAIKVD
jgi:hypothetical protein